MTIKESGFFFINTYLYLCVISKKNKNESTVCVCFCSWISGLCWCAKQQNSNTLWHQLFGRGHVISAHITASCIPIELMGSTIAKKRVRLICEFQHDRKTESVWCESTKIMSFLWINHIIVCGISSVVAFIQLKLVYKHSSQFQFISFHDK